MTPNSPAAAPAPLNLPAAIMFSLTTLAAFTVLPVYAWYNDFSPAAWAFFAFIMCATGLSITGGYHRMWAHRSYQAHWSLRLFYAAFGAMALQNSAMIWCSTHRVHHKHVDSKEQDPYSIRRGFWFAHMGWMLHDYPSGRVDLDSVPDIAKDPIAAFQHKHYVLVTTAMNLAFPLAVGSLFGDAFGFLLLGGLLRLVLNHHFTFFINSAAHCWGRRPYTRRNSARDNDLLALVTFGEAYHNYHHLFQWDYRNGVRWWHFDPTKWLIAGLSYVGVTRGLKRVPEFKIQRAMLECQFESTRERLADCAHPSRIDVLQVLMRDELEAFRVTLGEWSHLQTERFDNARKQLADQWDHSEMRRRLQVLENTLRMQRRRVRLLHLQTA